MGKNGEDLRGFPLIATQVNLAHGPVTLLGSITSCTLTVTYHGCPESLKVLVKGLAKELDISESYLEKLTDEVRKGFGGQMTSSAA
jgi:hypothetical protein